MVINPFCPLLACIWTDHWSCYSKAVGFRKSDIEEILWCGSYRRLRVYSIVRTCRTLHGGAPSWLICLSFRNLFKLPFLTCFFHKMMEYADKGIQYTIRFSQSGYSSRKRTACNCDRTSTARIAIRARVPLPDTIVFSTTGRLLSLYRFSSVPFMLWRRRFGWGRIQCCPIERPSRVGSSRKENHHTMEDRDWVGGIGREVTIWASATVCPAKVSKQRAPYKFVILW